MTYTTVGLVNYGQKLTKLIDYDDNLREHYATELN